MADRYSPTATLALLLPLLLLATAAAAQTENDVCAEAIPIDPRPVERGCDGSTFVIDLAGTTASGVPTACRQESLCDQWFTWTATTAGLTWVPSGSARAVAVYDACGGAELDCSSNTQRIEQRLTGWEVGDELRIRVFATDGRTEATFCLLEYDPPPPPVNDACATATVVTPGQSVCGEIATGSNVGATASVPPAVDDCTPSRQPDLWYAFVPTSTRSAMEIRTATLSLSYELYAGAADGGCAELAALVCNTWLSVSQQGRAIVFDGLTPGRTYYLRFSGVNPDVEGDFSFCLRNAPAPPANNACATAAALSLEDITTPAGQRTYTYFDNFAASASGDRHPDCFAETNADVYYRFTPSAANVFLERAGDAVGSAIAQIQTDDCGAGSVSVACSAGFPGRVSGLTPGQSYLLRVVVQGQLPTGSTPLGDFGFALIDDFPAPANDECVSAATIVPSASGTDPDVTTVTTFGASDSAPVGDECSARDNSYEHDVWLAFVPRQNSVRLDFSDVETAATRKGLRFTAYAGTCGELVATTCGRSARNGTHYLRGLAPAG